METPVSPKNEKNNRNASISAIGGLNMKNFQLFLFFVLLCSDTRVKFKTICLAFCFVIKFKSNKKEQNFFFALKPSKMKKVGVSCQENGRSGKSQRKIGVINLQKLTVFRKVFSLLEK